MSLFRFVQHVWALYRKDVSIVVLRQWVATFLRAVALPIAYMFFIAYCRNFFLPPSEYGIGSPNPIRNLTTEVFNSSTDLGGRNIVAFVNNGFVGGQIEQLIDGLSSSLRDAGADVRLLPNEDDLFDICPSSLTGLSRCYGAVSFFASPTEGPGGIWNYKARSDFGLGFSVYVNQDDNDAQKFVLPFVHAIDSGIAAIEGVDFPEPQDMAEYPFTYETREERDNEINRFFMGALEDYLAVTLFIGICGIAYHLPGHFASERELGMSSLIDAMLYARHRAHSMLARLVSVYLSFASVYILGWIAMGVIVSQLIFSRTDPSIIVFFHILTGFALTGYAIFFASFFRKAQLSGTITLLVALVLAIVAQFMPWIRVGHGVLSALFPPFTYTSFMIQLAGWEWGMDGANLSSYPYGYPRRNIQGYLYFVFLAIQIVIYPIAAAITQWVLYGTSLRAHGELGPEKQGVGLSVEHVSKTFHPFSWRNLWRPGSTKIKAVDDLSLSLAHGHIVALLGANGSGKSTTLANIAGTQNPTHGRIERDHSTGLGFCPQHNVLWDELSVAEHIRIFSALKAQSNSESKAQIAELVAACDLEKKVGAKSKTLSGGQKRKLQLAMAFVGGSKVCCVDEVSSGLDPLSRRKIWHILLAERGRRTMLLTTHALDEADALADQVAIMSKGKLAVEGSVPELKQRFGGGYRITSSEAKPPSMQDSTAVPDANGQITYTAATSSEACDLAKGLQRGGVSDFHFAGPSIEHVFLNISEEFTEETAGVQQGGSGDHREKVFSPVQQAEVNREAKALEIATGKGTSFPKQTWILFRKRLLIFTRNWVPYLCALLVPIATAGLATMFLAGFQRLLCSRGELTSVPRTLSLGALEAFWGILVPVGPPSDFSLAQLPAIYAPFVDRLVVQDSLAGFNGYIADNFRDVVPGGIYLDYNGGAAETTPAPLLAYRINGNMGYAALAKNVMDSYLMNITINAEFSTFALPFIGSTGDSLQLVIYTGLAMSAYIGFFALYPTFERRSNIRALHYSNGLRPAPLWLAYGLFDAFFVAIVAIVTTVLFTSTADVWFAPGYLGLVFFLFGVASTYLAYIVSLFATSQLAAFAFVAGGQAIFLLIYFLLYLVLLTFAGAESLQSNLNILQYALGLVSPSGTLLRTLLLSLNQSQILCRGQALVSYPGDFEAYGCPILYLTLQIICFYLFLVWFDNGKPVPFSLMRHRKAGDAMADDDEKYIKNVPFDVRNETARTEKADDKLRVLHLGKSFGRYQAVDDVTFGVDGGEKLALLGPNGAGKTTTLSLIRGDLRPSSRTSDVLISGLSIRKDQLAARRLLGVCPQFNTMDLMTVDEHLSFYARARGVPDIRSNVAKVIDAVGLTQYRKRMAGKLSGGNQRKLSLATAIIGNPSVLLLDEPSTGMDAVAMRVMWKAVRAICAGRAIIITTHSMEEASTLSDRTAIVDQRLLTVDTTREVIKRHGSGFYHVHIVLANGPQSTEEDMQRVREWVATSFKGAIMHDELFPDSRGQLRFQIKTTDTAAPPPSSSSSSSEPSTSDSATEDEPQLGRVTTGVRSAAAGDQLITMLDALESQKERLGIGYYTIGQATLEDVFLDVISKNRAL